MTASFATAVAEHELSLARVLADDLARAHPGSRLSVLVLDRDEGLDERAFDTVGISDLEQTDVGLLQVVSEGPRELAIALRPALLSLVLTRAGGPAIWLEPTVRVLAPLDPLIDAARRGVALAALHGRFEPARGLDRRGPYESGAVATAGGDELRWLAELTLEHARAAGAGFDPLRSDLLGALAAAEPRTAVVRERGLCAGWWTLAAGAELEPDPWRVGGEPLRAINLAGFDPRKPHWLSSEDPGGSVRVSQSAALAGLLAEHASELLAAGWEPPPGRWRYGALPNGLALGRDLRDLLALASGSGEAFDSPFTRAGCEAFMDWLDSESPIGAGVTWYLERVHRRRPDLQAAFPDLGGGDAPRLVAWMEEHGVDEEPVLAELLDRRASRRTRSAPVVSGSRAAGAAVRVVGYLGEGLGLGQAARSYTHALRTVGVEVDTASLPVPMAVGADPDRFWVRREVEWREPEPGAAEADVEIVCMNPPELMRAHRAGLVSAQRRHRVGVWAWELDTLPADWPEAAGLVDEVWAYSDYVASALRARVELPVEVMPLAVEPPGAPAPPRAPDSPFTFLFVCDLLSSIERKNPLGTIDAYRQAFDRDDGVRLLIKTSNGDNAPEQLERVRVAALGRPDVEVLDAFLPAAERDALIAGCDCYVSLHRAEGFGLTIAEAMAAARPAIATAYSGNLDFMDDDCAYLVPWEYAAVAGGDAIYPAGARWAEPDLDRAARLMRQVRDDPHEASARGRRGHERVAERLAPEVVGGRLKDRLDEIRRPSKARLRTTLARRMRR